MARRRRRPQIARTQNWREYFWARTKTASLILVGTLSGCNLLYYSRDAIPPEDLSFFAGILHAALMIAMIAVFVAIIWWIPAVIGWLWCVLMGLLGSTAEVARQRITKPQARPLILEDNEDDEPSPRVAEGPKSEIQFRPGPPRRRSEEIQE
jgi:hypothetical protein